MFDMSPTDVLPSPISPESSSPYQMTPTSPLSPAQEAFHYPSTPATPIIAPSVSLPRLVTSFNTSTNNFNTNHSSVDFQMSTPTPLRLDQTPISDRIAQHAKCEKMVDHDRTASGSRRNAVTLISSCVNQSLSPSRQIDHCEPDLLGISTLRHEDVMEGLEQMGTHFHTVACSISISLPLRISTTRNPRTLPPPWRLDEHSTQAPSTARTPCRKPQHVLNRHSLNQSRSPTSTDRNRIHRRRASRLTHRRNSSNASSDTVRPPVQLVIRPPNPHPLHHSLNHLRIPLVPLVSVLTGVSHPEFPLTLLQYHLLTHDQLDSLARWYHQTIDGGPQRWQYPAPLEHGKAWTVSTPGSTMAVRSAATNAEMVGEVHLEIKRRRWGRFIGLSGCESPVKTVRDGDEEPTNADDEDDDVTKKMEKQWKDALRRGEEEDSLREKVWRGRF